MVILFDTPDTRKLINSYIDVVKGAVTDTDFKKQRNKKLISILEDISNHASEWDNYSAYNAKELGEQLTHMLINKMQSEEAISDIFSMLFRFLMELNFNKYDNLSDELKDVKDFAFKERGRFIGDARINIDYSFNTMSFELMRLVYQGNDIQHFKKAAECGRLIDERFKEWDEKLEEKIGKSEELKAKLDEQENGFNFVGLYQGFDVLSKEKKIESRRAFWFTLLLGVLVLLPFSIDIILVYKETIKFDGTLSLFQFIPAFTLTFIFIYYFRVSLSNYISIKAQVNQIELRKTLCSFIQKYSEYAKEMKTNDGNSLEKFESIIFSNIMPSEDKIPSTFDGIEQIAKLIESVKRK